MKRKRREVTAITGMVTDTVNSAMKGIDIRVGSIFQNRVLALLLLLIPVMTSCSRPMGGYGRMSSEEAEAIYGGEYCFEADFFGENVSYNTFLAMRFDRHLLADSLVTFDVTLVNPGRAIYVERIDLPLYEATPQVHTEGTKGAVVDIEWPYRQNVVPDGIGSSGPWKIFVNPVNDNQVDKIYGMAFYYVLSEENGKR